MNWTNVEVGVWFLERHGRYIARVSILDHQWYAYDNTGGSKSIWSRVGSLEEGKEYVEATLRLQGRL